MWIKVCDGDTDKVINLDNVVIIERQHNYVYATLTTGEVVTIFVGTEAHAVKAMQLLCARIENGVAQLTDLAKARGIKMPPGL